MLKKELIRIIPLLLLASCSNKDTMPKMIVPFAIEEYDIQVSGADTSLLILFNRKIEWEELPSIDIVIQSEYYIASGQLPIDKNRLVIRC